MEPALIIPDPCLSRLASLHISASCYDILTIRAMDEDNNELWSAEDIDVDAQLLVDYMLLQVGATGLTSLVLTNVPLRSLGNLELMDSLLTGWKNLTALAFVGCRNIRHWLVLLAIGSFPVLQTLTISHSDYHLPSLVDMLVDRAKRWDYPDLATIKFSRALYNPVTKHPAWPVLVASVREVRWEWCFCTMSTRCWRAPLEDNTEVELDSDGSIS
ncbi:hypothetical protein EVJ58_g2248 [Rhodofomes roseus]|uniref:Uncharacterized protein n=1 Tax=Rhodofomes roseus TaxID=34475 RepID=A0A4Y9YV47_9APHY|nr:hypothetical protein EVJ58_g2248 [Rhodofomes roseus]